MTETETMRALKCCGGTTYGRSQTEHEPTCPSIVRAALSWIEESSIGERQRQHGLAAFDAILEQRDALAARLAEAETALREMGDYASEKAIRDIARAYFAGAGGEA